MKKSEMDEAIFDMDIVLTMLIELKEKAILKANESNNIEFKIIVKEYEVLINDLVNDKFQKLYKVATSRHR